MAGINPHETQFLSRGAVLDKAALIGDHLTFGVSAW
jgi:hypothetical protein